MPDWQWRIYLISARRTMHCRPFDWPIGLLVRLGSGIVPSIPGVGIHTIASEVFANSSLVHLSLHLLHRLGKLSWT